MKKLAKVITDVILWLGRTRSEKTYTEKAFYALQTLEKMRMYIKDHELISTCSDVVDNATIKKYGIEGYTQVWAALCLLKKCKNDPIPQVKAELN